MRCPRPATLITHWRILCLGIFALFPQASAGAQETAAAQASNSSGFDLAHYLVTYAWPILITVAIGVVAWLLLRTLITTILNKAHLAPAVQKMAYRGLRWTMVLVIGLAVIQQLGVEVGMLWGVLSAGLAMVAIGFVAVWSVLSNTTSAFILLMARPFRIGDSIEITEATGGPALKGKLVDISLIYTTIEEPENGQPSRLVRIPNNVLLQKTIRVIPCPQGGVDLGEHISGNTGPNPGAGMDPAVGGEIVIAPALSGPPDGQ